MQSVHYRLLQWAGGIFCAVIGAMMLVVPHQFNIPTYAALQPYLNLWGMLFVLAGAALLIAVGFNPGRLPVMVIHFLTGCLLLVFAYALTQTWSSAINYMVLGFGIISVPRWAGDENQDKPAQIELLGLVMGLTAVMDGLLRFAVLFTQASAPISILPPGLALVSVVGGLIMLAAQFVPAVPTRIRQGAYILLGLCVLFWIVQAAAPIDDRIGMAWYAGSGLLLVLAPWLEPRLSRPKTDSLRVRLTLTLVLVATIPLVVQMALTTNRQGQTATNQALTFQRRLVTAQSQHIANYVDLYRSAVAAFAAQPGLLSMTPQDRRLVVQAFKNAYPDTLMAGTYDIAGNVLTRSDGLSAPALTDLDIYKTIRATNKPGLQITMARTYKRIVFVFGAPIQDEAGAFAGVALFSVDTVHLNDLLTKANVDGKDTLYLVDTQGHVIVHPDDSLVQTQADLSQRSPVAHLLAEKATGSMVYTPSQGDPQLAAYALVSGVGWGVIAERPLAATMAGIWSDRDTAFVLLAALVAAGALIGMMLARSLIAPLWNVANALNRWVPDGLPVFLDASSRLSEISLLTTAFNSLQQRLADRTAERDRAERTLRDERERLQVTLTSIGDAVIVTDPSGQVTFMNPVAASLTGWTAAAAQGQPLASVFHIVNEMTRQPVENPAAKVLRDNVIAGLANHTVLLARDGREVPIDDSGAPIRGADGCPIGVILVFRDITQRRQAERQISAAYAEADRDRRRLEAVLHALPVGVSIADSNASVIKYNAQLDLIWNGLPSVSNVNGYQQYKGWWADSGKPVAPEEWALPRAALAGETVVGQIINIERFDGQKRTIINSGAPIKDEQGRLIGGVVAVQDITAFKEAEDRLRFLADLGAVLTASFDFESIRQRLPALIVPRLADNFTLDVFDIDEQGLYRRAFGASNLASEEVLSETDTLRDPCVMQFQAVLKSQKPLLVAEITDTFVEKFDAERLDRFRRVGNRSMIIVPLLQSDAAIGVICLGMAASGRRYTQDDLAFCEVIASRISIVMTNARLYESELQARRLAQKTFAQVSQLQAITAALSRALTPEQVGEVILSQGLTAVDATAGSIVLRLGGSLQVVYSTGYAPELIEKRRLIAFDAPIPVVEVIRTGRPFWFESPEELTSRYSHLPFNEDKSGRAAWAIAPLQIDEQIIGAMTLSFSMARQFSPEDRAFILALAQHCAQALERANLYDQVRRNAEVLEQTVEARTEELRQALEQAESADRAKMVMLSTVTHEMRTPLSSIVGFSHLLLKRNLDADKATTFTTAINSEGRRLARLIDDFLDLQRIDAGRAVFHFEALDLPGLIKDVAAMHQNGEHPFHTLCMNVEPVPQVYADSDRIRQVILNLLSNAFKYSPEGSTVTLTLRQKSDEVIFSVQDQGLGIPPGDLPHLFERFKRGEIAEELRIQGIGLGLALCKEIIQAHRGRIWAESAGPNQGSTFYFTLPLVLAQPPSTGTGDRK